MSDLDQASLDIIARFENETGIFHSSQNKAKLQLAIRAGLERELLLAQEELEANKDLEVAIAYDCATRFQQETIETLCDALLEAADILDGSCDDEGNLCSNADAVEYRTLVAEIKGK